jgi:hypothetical protein
MHDYVGRETIRGGDCSAGRDLLSRVRRQGAVCFVPPETAFCPTSHSRRARRLFHSQIMAPQLLQA